MGAKAFYWVVTCSAVAGCSFIDDFDFEVADGGPGDADGPDARADGGPSDGGPSDGGPDDGGDVGPSDGGDGGPGDGGDGGPCEPPCVGDVFEDIDGAGPWSFHEQQPDLDLVPLVMGTRHENDAWQRASMGPPAVTACGSGSGACSGHRGRVLVEAEPDGNPAVMMFTAAADGAYNFQTSVRQASGASDVLVARNHPWDFLLDASGAEDRALGPTYPLLAGDTVRFALSAVEPGVVGSESFTIRVGRLDSPGACQAALRFDDDRFTVECGARFTVAEAGMVAGGGAGPLTTSTAGILGGARRFPPNAALRLEGTNFDYSGDFTVQMWVRVQTLDRSDTEIYSDFSGNPSDPGGIDLELNPGAANRLTLNYRYGGCGDACDGEVSSGPFDFDLARWHFIRVSRFAATEEIRLCVDGQHLGTGVVPNINISTTRAPHFGGSGSGFSIPTFDGDIDDFRVYSVALPCGD